MTASLASGRRPGLGRPFQKMGDLDYRGVLYLLKLQYSRQEKKTSASLRAGHLLYPPHVSTMMAAAMALRRREAMEREHMAGEDARSMVLESRVRRVSVMRHVGHAGLASHSPPRTPMHDGDCCSPTIYPTRCSFYNKCNGISLSFSK